MNNNIPGYKIKQSVYVGKAYSIFFAMNKNTRNHHYLKVINSAYPDVKEISQLQHEMELIKDIENDYIIRIDDFIEYHNTFALVMEAIPGGRSLETVLQNGPLSVEQFLQVAIAITQGVTALHQQNIIHKDIKPSNIVVSEDLTTAKIIDFGISVQLNCESSEMQFDTLLQGSLPYISPEQTGRLSCPIDYRSDFYSLGCTFYEMLAGQTPFHAIDKEQWIKCHTLLKPKKLFELVDYVPKILSDMILILLEKNPEDRYQSSYALQQDLIDCLEQYQESQIIWSFALSQHDLSDKFLISNRLIGRESELADMNKYMNNKKNDGVNLTEVIGYSGIGKTAFVNEIRSLALQKDSVFIRGKHQQYYSGVPYQALIDAFSQLIKKIMRESKVSYEEWQRKIKNALGENAMVMVELIPDLKKILGDVQLIAQLGPRETLNRFILTILKFIQIFARRDHPLILFIDDLQWADPASLTLIKNIVLSTEIEALNIIISYRSNEVDEYHVLSSVLEDIRITKNINNITLENLSAHQINQVVAESLHSTSVDCSALANLVYKKTVGNPFFTKQLLQTLYRDGHITFDYEKGCWKYDLSNIKKINLSDNVAEFLINRMNLLTETTREVLSTAGLIGAEFSFSLLIKINKKPVSELINAINEAVMQNIIEPISGNYNLLNSALFCNSERLIKFKFVHDRLQKAACKLLPIEEQAKIHLALGRLLMQNPDKYQANEMVIANHMNNALHLIKDNNELFQVAENNVLAAKNAIKTSAYEIAFQFLDTLYNYISDDYWLSQYEFTSDMYYQYIKCAYLLGQYNLADQLMTVSLEHSKTKLEKAEVLKLKCVMNVALSSYDDALSAGLTALALFGIKLQKVPSKLTIMKHLFKTKKALKKNNIEQMTEFPKMEDEEHIMISDLIGELLAPAYLCEETNETLLPVLIFKGLSLSLEHGFSKESCYFFEAFAFIQSVVFNDYQLAYNAGRLGCLAAERLNSIDFMCRTYCVYTLFIIPWNGPYEDMISGFLKSIKYGAISGDHQYLSYSAMHISLYDPYMNFKERVELSNKHLGVLDKAEYYDVKLQGNLVKNFWRNLCGELDNNSDLTSNGFNETAYLKRVMDLKVVTSLAQYYVLKMCLCYYHNEFEQSYQLIKKVDEHYHAISGMAIVIEFSLFSFLTLLKVYSNASRLERFNIKRRMNKEYRRVKKWARHHKENFNHIKLMMEAAFAQLSGRSSFAVVKYEQASNAAKNIRHLRHDAIICEVAGQFMLECKHQYLQTASERLTEALVINNRLSCVIKSRQLKRYQLEREYDGKVELFSSKKLGYKVSRS